MKNKGPLLDFEIDKLTNSIENTLTGEVFDTEIEKISWENRRLIKKSEWVFDWHLELKAPDKEVYKLTTIINSGIIQGLICLEDKKDHVFLHLLESAKFNKGEKNIYGRSRKFGRICLQIFIREGL